jgi:hypothetical protein
VLQQRAAFLRPDSVLLIVLVSDEDDCSIRDGGQYFFAAQSQLGGSAYHLPRARSECAADPADPCCTSCGQQPPANCPPNDLNCGQGALSEAEDPINLRCFDQKRRFGIDFLQPLDRYLEGLTNRQVADNLGRLHDNPLFVGNRSPDMVMVAAIAGVPWQDIAIATTNPGAGFVPAPEIPWSRVLRDPETGAPPEDPLMIPSRAPRSGANPVTGDELAPPEATSATANPINGHEHLLPDDLQYACIYQLTAARDCAAVESCDCNDPNNDNPLCYDTSLGQFTQMQHRAKAYPGIRELQVLKAAGERGIAGSICPQQVSNPSAADYGYRPTMITLLEAIRSRLPN